jgi:hypothetical protein
MAHTYSRYFILTPGEGAIEGDVLESVNELRAQYVTQAAALRPAMAVEWAVHGTIHHECWCLGHGLTCPSAVSTNDMYTTNEANRAIASAMSFRLSGDNASEEPFQSINVLPKDP